MRASIRRAVVVATVLCLTILIRQLPLHDWEEWRSGGYSPRATVVDVPPSAPLNATALTPADVVANPPTLLSSASAAVVAGQRSPGRGGRLRGGAAGSEPVVCPQAARIAALAANLSTAGTPCHPVDLTRCVAPTSLRELAAGGCFRLSGLHRLEASLLLPCPVHIESAGSGRAVLSGGEVVAGWSAWAPDGADTPVGWRSAPTAPIRNLFAASSRRAELGPLSRLPRARASVSSFRLTTVKDGFVGASSFCSWYERGDAPLELVYRGRNWSEPRCAIRSVRLLGSDDDAGGGGGGGRGRGRGFGGSVGGCAVQMAQPCHHNVCPMPNEAGACKGVRVALRLENTPQTLQPGQWAQTHDGRVLLRRGNASAPLPFVSSAKATKADAASSADGGLPTTDPRALRRTHRADVAGGGGRGDDGEGRPPLLLAPRVEGLLLGLNVSARRLKLVLSAFAQPTSDVGFAETQGGHYADGWRRPKAAPMGRVCPISAALVAEVGEIEECVVGASGGVGVHLLRSGRVERCSFRDVSGGAIALGGVDHSRPSRGAVARCNDVRRSGAEFGGSVGIWGGYLAGGTIEGNTVAETPYSAISVGWGWTWHPSCETSASPTAGLGCGHAADNAIVSNVVRSPMLRMRDGAGIYTLGPQPRSRVADNCVLGAVDPQRRSFERRHVYALYHDDGSAGFVSTRNTFSEGSSVLIKGRNAFHNSSVLTCGSAADAEFGDADEAFTARRGWCYAPLLSHAQVRARKHGGKPCGFVPDRGLVCEDAAEPWAGTCVLAPPGMEHKPAFQKWKVTQPPPPHGGIEQALKDMHAIAYRDSRLSCDIRAGCRNHTDAVCAAARGGGGGAGGAARRAGAARGKGRGRVLTPHRSAKPKARAPV